MFLAVKRRIRYINSIINSNVFGKGVNVMRTLFIPLAKLLGIYEIFRGLSYILFIISRAVSRQSLGETVIISCAIHAISLLLAIVLILKAERIADILKIPQDKTDSLVFNADSVLRAGLLLIGIGTLIYAVPFLIRSIIGLAVVTGAERPEMFQFQRHLYMAELSASILRIVLGGCLVLLANRLAQFLSKSKEQT